jgi:acetolactate synthase I/II/III large subunit
MPQVSLICSSIWAPTIPAFIAAFTSEQHSKLQIFTSPNDEMNTLSAASGFAQITGRPAAVLVHVECGTQGLGAAVHNISRGRIPTLILAGTSPVTMEGEELGRRNE